MGDSLDEYEQRWAGQLERRKSEWPDLVPAEFAASSSSYGCQVLTALLADHAVQISSPDYFASRTCWLTALLRKYGRDRETIVEIGAGAGKNLPAIAMAGFDRILAIEPTASGCAAISDIGRRIGTPVSVIRGALPRLPVRTNGSRALILTNHVLEQMPGMVAESVAAIAAIGDVRVINIEPTFVPRSWLRHPAAETIDMLYRRRRRYSSTLWLCLQRGRLANNISLIHYGTAGLSPRMLNVPNILVWEPKR